MNKNELKALKLGATKPVITAGPDNHHTREGLVDLDAGDGCDWLHSMRPKPSRRNKS